MTRKSLLCAIFILVIFNSGIAIQLNSSASAEPNKKPLWNLQKLEEVAETGDAEAQLRLIDFYQTNINSRDGYKKKLEYWKQKSEAQKASK